MARQNETKHTTLDGAHGGYEHRHKNEMQIWCHSIVTNTNPVNSSALKHKRNQQRFEHICEQCHSLQFVISGFRFSTVIILITCGRNSVWIVCASEARLGDYWLVIAYDSEKKRHATSKMMRGFAVFYKSKCGWVTLWRSGHWISWKPFMHAQTHIHPMIATREVKREDNATEGNAWSVTESNRDRRSVVTHVLHSTWIFSLFWNEHIYIYRKR